MKPILSAVLALALAGLAHAAPSSKDEGTRYIALVNGGKDKAGHLITTRDG